MSAKINTRLLDALINEKVEPEQEKFLTLTLDASLAGVERRSKTLRLLARLNKIEEFYIARNTTLAIEPRAWQSKNYKHVTLKHR